MFKLTSKVATAVGFLACVQGQGMQNVFSMQTYTGGCMRISGIPVFGGVKATIEKPCGTYESYRYVNNEIRNTNTGGKQKYCLMSAPDFSVYWLPVPVPILGMEVVDTCSKWNSVIVGDAEHWFIKIDQFCVDWATDPMATRDCRVNTIDQRWSLPPVPLPSPSSSPSGPPINGVASNSPTPSPFDVVAPSRTPGTQPTATGYVIVNQESQTCIARGKKLPGTNFYYAIQVDQCAGFEAITTQGPSNGNLISNPYPNYCLFYSSDKTLQWIPCGIARSLWEGTTSLKDGSECYDFDTKKFERCDGSPSQVVRYQKVE